MTYLKTSVFVLLALAIPAIAQEVNPRDRREARSAMVWRLKRIRF